MISQFFGALPGDFPCAQHMRYGHQMKRVDLSFAEQFES